ncbi:MAG TPA: phage scaffolding protein [Candidatus Paenibacillus intestinavium]|nr:phage scaffolding protein [Candidatus Paenibacillus intestinavium]
MNKEEFIALGLTDEQAAKAATASAEELKGFIPKARFDEVNTAKKTADDALKERDKQLDDLKKSSGDAEALKLQITQLQTDNQTAKEKYEADAKDLQLSTALKLSLSGKVHDPDIVTGLLDKTKIELDENGNIKAGFDDQVKALQTSKAFLFVPEDAGNNAFTFKGAKPPEGGGAGGGGGTGNKAADFGKRVAEFGKPSNDTAKARESYF